MYASFGYIFVTRLSLVVSIMHIMYRPYTDREVRLRSVQTVRIVRLFHSLAYEQVTR